MNKKTLDDIFNDDAFGLLDVKPKASNIKTEDDRLIDAFEEINSFVDKNAREPSSSSMSEYTLLAKLKNFREKESIKRTLKPYDRHDLLGYVEMDKLSIDDILSDDQLGLLDDDSALDIFRFNHTPKPQDRADTDYVSKRTLIKESEFEVYEKMFHQVQRELKEGIRRFEKFGDAETHLKEGRFYLLDGLLLYLERIDFKREVKGLGKETRRRKDGRTRTIFENATLSTMLYRSLGKALYNNGKLVTEPGERRTENLFVHENTVKEEDIGTGCIYVVKSLSDDPNISGISDLYKVGFSGSPVNDRIKNAKNEATYLFADVKIVASYRVYNRNAYKLEGLLHRFFAKVCLNIDLYDAQEQRVTPREWFVVPLEIIEEAVKLILKESIVNYEYDVENQQIKMKR